MLVRRLAPLSLLLMPQVALAAPPDDRPPVQRPSDKPDDGANSGDQSVTENTSTSATGEAQPGETTPNPEPGTEAEPGDSGADLPAEPSEPAEAIPSELMPDAAAEPEPEPAGEGTEAKPDADPDEPDLSNLLDSDEPEAGPTRVRVARSGAPERVDRNERLRNYYASIYRPDHNPSRLYFAARGAYALAGTGEGKGGGRMGFANVELGQTWNYIGYGVGATVMGGSLTFGDEGVENFGGFLIGGGPSLGLGRLGLLGRGFIDLRAGYNFFYAPVSATRENMADPPDAAPHGPKVQVDAGLLFHGTEARRFRHGLGASIGWQGLVHSLAGDFPMVNTFTVGVGYFFG